MKPTQFSGTVPDVSHRAEYQGLSLFFSLFSYPTSSFVHRVLSAIEIADKDKTTALSLGYRWCTNRCSRSSAVYGAYASEAHVVVRHASSGLDITTYSRFKEKHNYYYYYYFFIYWKCSHFVCIGRSMCILTVSFQIYIHHRLWQFAFNDGWIKGSILRTKINQM